MASEHILPKRRLLFQIYAYFQVLIRLSTIRFTLPEKCFNFKSCLKHNSGFLIPNYVDLLGTAANLTTASQSAADFFEQVFESTISSKFTNIIFRLRKYLG